MGDIFALAELAGPFPAFELASRVRWRVIDRIDRNLFPTDFVFAILTRTETKRGIRRNKTGN